MRLAKGESGNIHQPPL